jgi:predicted secreted protein
MDGSVDCQGKKEDEMMQNRTMGSWMLVPLLAGSFVMAAGACSRTSMEAKVDSSVTITKADQDRTVTIATGGLVTVKLAWSPGTGYDWALTRNDPSLLQQEGGAASEPAKEPKPGAPETRVFRFKALKAGSTALEFQSRRGFEKEAPPQDTFRVQVVISN